MDARIELSAVERRRGQRAALIANLPAHVIQFVVLGPIMMLFATDVLRLPPKQVAGITAMIPALAILRFPLLGRIRRWGMRRTLLIGDLIRIAIAVALIALPASWLGFPTYAVLVLGFAGSFYVLKGSAWQPLLRDITTVDDRGRFFARMRFAFTLAAAGISLIATVIVGEVITEGQYKLLLGAALAGLLVHLVFAQRIPELPPEAPSGSERSGVLAVARRSPLLRRPLIVAALLMACVLPIMPIYLRQLLGIPSNLVSAWVLCATIGATLSFLLWGRLSDAIGFKPLLIGLLVIIAAARPLLLLVAPYPDGGVDWSHPDLGVVVSIGALLLFGLFQGALNAGTGIASISLQHFHADRRDAVTAMAVFSAITVGVQALSIVLTGWLLEDVAMPAGSAALWGGALHLDWIKGYLIFAVPLIQLVIVLVLLGVPNARPEYGVGDFFASVIANPLRTMGRLRRVHDEDEARREDLARWLALRPGPLGDDGLVALLDDPSYDVRVEAVRALGLGGGAIAGPRLLLMLEDGERRQLWDHVAWALGELGCAPAVPRLRVLATDDAMPNRIRAMAVRALGKIGAREAADDIAAILAAGGDSRHLQGSCARSLARLDAVEHAALVFRQLPLFEDRFERYELLTVCCGWLGIPNRWLIAASTELKPYEMWGQHVEARRQRWRDARAETLAAYAAKDHAAVQALAAAAPDRSPLERALVAAAAEQDQWNTLITLTLAWCCLRR